MLIIVQNVKPRAHTRVHIHTHTVPRPLSACARTIPWFPPWTATEPAALPHSAADPPAPYCEPTTHSNVSNTHTYTFYIPLFFILLLLSLFFTISILNPISTVSVSRRVTKRRVASAYDVMSWHREKIKQLRVDALLNMEATGSV